MKLKKLGKTGTLVSSLCLGSMTFGWQADEVLSHRLLDRFQEAGGNFIDTADVYAGGNSEEIIGSWLQGKDRESIVLATKARFKTGDHANGSGLSRKHLISAVSASLKRLKTDYVDLLQVHAWDPLTSIEETFGTLSSLVDEGFVRYIGVSNYRGWQFEKALQTCKQRGWSEPVSIQPHYNILQRATEFEILPVAIAEDIAVIPWSPLAGGILTGKYKDGIGKASKGTRIGDSRYAELYKRYDNERTYRVLQILSKISGETGTTMAQVALSWVMSKPAITSPIIGARNSEQLEDNLGAAEMKISSEQIEEINLASKLDVSYPYDQVSEDQQNRDRQLE